MGMADGVVTGGSITDTTLTLTRSIGGDLTITGLPEGLDTAEVNALIGAVVVYHDGNGPPATAPASGGLLAVDNAGHLYGAITETITHTMAPAITTQNLVTGGIEGYYRGYDTAQLQGDVGRFQYTSFNHQFRQLRAGTPNFIQNATWGEAMAYIFSVDNSVDYRQSIYLGSFGDAAAAAQAMSLNGAALTAYSGGVPADNLKAYYIDTGTPVLRRVQTFTAGTTTTTERLTWANEALTIGSLRNHVKDFVEVGSRGVRVGDMDAESSTVGQVPRSDGASGVAWGDDAQRTISTSTPQPVGTPAAGVSGTVSDAAHVHGQAPDTTARLLPSSPSDNQIARYDSGTSAWIAEDLPAGFNYFVSTPSPLNRTATPGTSANVARGDHAHAGTSTSLADMPATIEARKLLLGNAGATAYELVDQPKPVDAIPEVAELPDGSLATSPPAVLLPFAYTEGMQQNPTLTVGFDSGEAGYSDGSVLSDAYGSVSTLSPLNAMFGGGTSASYSIQAIASSHEDWINEFTHVLIAGTEYALGPTFVSLGAFERRIQGFPTGLTTSGFAFNFKRADNTWWFTDGSNADVDAGLYVKIDDGYEIVTSRGVDHIDGFGEPEFDPTHAAQVYVDNEGKMWVSGDEIRLVSNPPTYTVDAFSDSYYLQTAITLAAFESGATNGQFVWFGTGFIQDRQDQTFATTWEGAWEYIIMFDDTAEHRGYRDNYTVLGSFDSEEDAALDRNDITPPGPDHQYLFLVHSSDPGTSIILRRFATFTAAATVEVDHFFWRGPQIISTDAIDIIGDTIVANGTGTPTANLVQLEANGVVYDTEDIVHPDRQTGTLRDPTELDWNTACNCSRNIAWDGNQFLEVERYFEGAHSADAVFTEVPLLTTFTYDGTTYRWRGTYNSAGPNINQQLHDFYFWTTRLSFQEWANDHGVGSPYWQIRDGFGLGLWEAIDYAGQSRTQDGALGRASANGQRVVYERSPERARGTVRFTGAEDTAHPAGHRVYVRRDPLPHHRGGSDTGGRHDRPEGARHRWRQQRERRRRHRVYAHDRHHRRNRSCGRGRFHSRRRRNRRPAAVHHFGLRTARCARRIPLPLGADRG